jgi:hypothetical protein
LATEARTPPQSNGTSDLASICTEIRRETSLVDSEPATAGKLLIPTLNDQEGAPRRWPLPRVLLRCGPPRAPEDRKCFGVVALFDTASVPHSWVTVGMRSLQFRRGGSSGRGAAADNPHVTTVEPESLTPAGRRWIERTQGPLDLLAVIFLIDVILIWSFPEGRQHS